MTFTFARVDPETLEIVLSYNTNGGPKWAPEDLECLVPFEVVSNIAVIVDGQVTLQADPQKVQARLDQAWRDLRSERNARLQASDWVALADANLSQAKKDAWFAYRQELRDLPEEVTLTSPQDLDAIVWPSDPNAVPQAPVSGSRLSNLLDHAEVTEPAPEAPVESEPAPEVTEPVSVPVESEPAQEVAPEAP